ncbi:MAG: ATP-binding protein, partial [Pelagibacterales bacterium]|nr:ATP-binding protein [Pelagibacterales bacterium]
HPAHPINLLLSAALIEWVIENILKNALDAMEGVGMITIEIIEQAEEVHVDITDTGKGISAALQNEIFNPGFTTKKRGWGLGLTLARRIVQEYHNGKLTVKNSELGKGTTFRLAFMK